MPCSTRPNLTQQGTHVHNSLSIIIVNSICFPFSTILNLFSRGIICFLHSFRISQHLLFTRYLCPLYWDEYLKMSYKICGFFAVGSLLTIHYEVEQISPFPSLLLKVKLYWNLFKMSFSHNLLNPNQIDPNKTKCSTNRDTKDFMSLFFTRNILPVCRPRFFKLLLIYHFFKSDLSEKEIGAVWFHLETVWKHEISSTLQLSK